MFFQARRELRRHRRLLWYKPRQSAPGSRRAARNRVPRRRMQGEFPAFRGYAVAPALLRSLPPHPLSGTFRRARDAAPRAFVDLTPGDDADLASATRSALDIGMFRASRAPQRRVAAYVSQPDFSGGGGWVH